MDAGSIPAVSTTSSRTAYRSRRRFLLQSKRHRSFTPPLLVSAKSHVAPTLFACKRAHDASARYQLFTVSAFGIRHLFRSTLPNAKRPASFASLFLHEFCTNRKGILKMRHDPPAGFWQCQGTLKTQNGQNAVSASASNTAFASNMPPVCTLPSKVGAGKISSLGCTAGRLGRASRRFVAASVRSAERRRPLKRKNILIAFPYIV